MEFAGTNTNPMMNATSRNPARPERSQIPAQGVSGHWVTMHGTHVFIKDGVPTDPSRAGAAHNIVSHGKFYKGARVHYSGGRGPDGSGTVLSVGPTSMLVQFDDRADTTTIGFNEPDWMNHLHLSDTHASDRRFMDFAGSGGARPGGPGRSHASQRKYMDYAGR